MKIFTVAAMIGTLAFGSIAVAQTPINVRQANQQRRIDAGHRSGKLTDGEDRRLKAEQRSIAALAEQLRRRHGGHLTDADNRLIHARQDAADRHILQQKGNGRRGKDHLAL